ncbi:hypothetical protein ACFJZ3_004143 [Vibrio vulnificus]
MMGWLFNRRKHCDQNQYNSQIKLTNGQTVYACPCFSSIEKECIIHLYSKDSNNLAEKLFSRSSVLYCVDKKTPDELINQVWERYNAMCPKVKSAAIEDHIRRMIADIKLEVAEAEVTQYKLVEFLRDKVMCLKDRIVDREAELREEYPKIDGDELETRWSEEAVQDGLREFNYELYRIAYNRLKVWEERNDVNSFARILNDKIDRILGMIFENKIRDYELKYLNEMHPFYFAKLVSLVKDGTGHDLKALIISAEVIK